jgi:hypothetical protein
VARIGSYGSGEERARRGQGPTPKSAVAAGFFVFVVSSAVAGGACSATGARNEFDRDSDGGGDPGGPGSGGGDTGEGGGLINPAGGGGGPPIIGEDPKTCEDAALAKSYVGCDFWPTVVDNIVYELFDYAVAVANAGDVEADVTVTRNGATIATAKVPPNGLETLYLPWVDELKSTQSPIACAGTSNKTQTVRAEGGAYHLVSTRPVTVYQFNAIEYAGVGGPQGKDWSPCSGFFCAANGCFSFTNDASLILPSTALTGNFRVTGPRAWADPDNNNYEIPPYFAVTGIKDGTQVTVSLSAMGSIAGGGGVPSAGAGGKVTFTIDSGDVVQVIGGPGSDLGGTLVQASAPVQVISGIACSNMPFNVDACDHLEESVLPAETLGRHYFVTVPTSHHGSPVGAVVRIYGNVDATKLTYPGQKPGGAPDTINAGQVVDLGVINQDFEIVGDHEFAVETFQVGASMIDPGVPPNQQKGDPAESQMTAVEQYRKKYIFLAPTDYNVSFVDIVQPVAAQVTLDGAPVTAEVKPLSSGFGIARVQLGPGNNGAHVLTATDPVGIQVMGYGTYTSYQYAGGLNLGQIAPPPPPPK